MGFAYITKFFSPCDIFISTATGYGRNKNIIHCIYFDVFVRLPQNLKFSSGQQLVLFFSVISKWQAASVMLSISVHCLICQHYGKS